MKRALTILCSLFLGSIICCGQESPADTLSPSAVIASALRSATPVQFLEGRSLERLSNNTVADALRYFSGIQIKDYGGIGGLKTVNVRSLGAQHVGIFYDGIKITNAQNGQVDLGRYSLDNLEQIAVYNGQKSEALQSASDYASASSVYLRTRRPSFDSRDWNLSARLKYGSFSSLNTSLRYERKLRRAVMAAEAMFLDTKGDYPFTIRTEYEDTCGRRFNGDIRAARAEFVLFSDILGGEFQTHVYAYGSERGLPGPVVRRLSEQYATHDRQKDENFFAQASYTRKFGKLSFRANGKGAYDYLRYDSPTSGYEVHNHYHQKDLYGSASLAYFPWEWLSANIALDERWSDLNCDVPYYNYVQRFDTRAAAALSASLEGFTANISLLYTHIQDVTRGGKDPLERLTPTVVLGWRKGAVALRAFWKSIFREPTLNDMYYSLIGNAELKPEYTRQLDFGADIRLAASESFSSKLSFDIYANRITDKIVAMPARSQFRWSMVNYGSVRGLGLDSSLNSSLRSGEFELTSLLTFSYEKASDVSDPDSHYYGGQLPYTPFVSGSAVTGISRGEYHLNLSYIYTGARYRASDNAPENRMEPWTSIDMSISKEFTLKHCTMEAGLDLNNILNQQYEVVTRYPMPGFNIMGKTIFKF